MSTEQVLAKVSKKSLPMFDAKFRILCKVGKYPLDWSADLWCTLTGLMEINGTKAFTLFNSGVETDVLSPDFIRACHIPLLELPSPLVLQMGTKGSRSCIYYGTNVDLAVLDNKTVHHFDLINIERYDAILGAPWLNTHSTMLDFGKHIVHVNGGQLKTFDIPTECSFVSTGRQAWGTLGIGLKKRPDSDQATYSLSSPKK